VSDVRDCRIAIVDDHEATLIALRDLLRDGGFENVLATSAPVEVLDAVDEGNVDLVILDFRPEGIDGFRLMEEIDGRRGPSAYLPILMLTAEGSSSLRHQALATGAHDFVVKPFDASEVLLRIRNLLTTRALHLEVDRHRRTLEAELDRHHEHARAEEALRSEKVERVRRALVPASIRLVFQPMFALGDGRLLGAECLTRFDLEPDRPPNEWFADADDVGLGAALELASVRAAVAHVGDLPDGAFLAVNVSAQVAASAALVDVLTGIDLGRVVIELTEHAPVADYERLRSNLAGVRSGGARVAIDDAGAGYASFQHILRLRPDFIKLDLDLTRGIDHDPVRRALATALVTFGSEIGSLMIAEGVEHREELATLRELGFAGAQGYYLGRPAPLPVATSMISGAG
jgi:EAL domain-containing protein (putative c-di-GMP-specific phosphodiesterase class I)/ActR/RegA family two-component response regulator